MIAAILALQFQNDPILSVPRPDEWWQKRHEAIVNRAKQGDVDLVFIGDSITHSFGGFPNVPEGWNGGKNVWNKFYADRKPLNLGFSGDRTQHVLWRLYNGEMEGIKPKVIVMMIGTNNQAVNTPAQTAEGVEAIVNWLQTNQRQAKILLLDIFPRDPNPDNTLRRKVEATNRLLQSIRGVTHLNLDSVFLDERGVLPKEIMPDFLHPNEEGYRRWAEAMEPTLKKML
jgi:lysophospholipase L1-like esterase